MDAQTILTLIAPGGQRERYCGQLPPPYSHSSRSTPLPQHSIIRNGEAQGLGKVVLTAVGELIPCTLAIQ